MDQTQPTPKLEPEVERAISQPMVLDTKQQEAIELCCDPKNRLAGVTGQAGTGKTTIMKQVFDRFKEAGHYVALAAPTGKASKRIAEATGIHATTIHRLLEFTHPGDPDPKTGKPLQVSVPRRTFEHPLDQSVILVDEYSMVNKQLHRDLVDAMNRGAILRVFGDVNQLPPIEEDKADNSPSPFMNMLRQFPSVTLETIHRQGEGSTIVKNGHRILQGMMPFSDDEFRIHWTQPLAPNDPVTKVLKLVRESGIDFNSVDNQIATPINRSWVGQEQLNQKIQDIIHGDRVLREGFPMPREKWDKVDLILVKGDKVIWKKNDYNLEIFNGETGIVEDIANDIIYINFGDRVVGVPPSVLYTKADGTQGEYDPRARIYLAYALTTHATQGSEYHNVVYVLDNSAFSMLYRGNFYTAVTRARKHVDVVSDQRSLQRAVSNKTAWMPSKKKG